MLKCETRQGIRFEVEVCLVDKQSETHALRWRWISGSMLLYKEALAKLLAEMSL